MFSAPLRHLMMTIENSTAEDIPEIFRLYRLATAYQRLKFPDNQWPEFDPALIQTEVAEKRQFKLLIDDCIACIWAITYSDPQIWEEKDCDPAVYIHRIATNPEFRGNNFVMAIAEWAREFGKAEGKAFVRMDTCGNNERLIAHYGQCGFRFLGMKKLANSSELPAHYHGADVCFFEMALA